MRFRWLISFLGLTTVIACSSPTTLDGFALVLPGAGSLTAAMDPAEIMSARIEDNRLRLQVSHAAGCSDHAFSLLHDGIFLESNPVQTNLQLAHDANGEPCRALAMPVLYFDLAPLAELYRKAYGGDGGAIVLHIRAPGAVDPIRPPLLFEF